MNISSVILRARRDKLDGVRRGLAAMPGVEIHADGNDGRLVLTLEDAGSESSAEAFVKLHHMDGVLGASLIYQYSDDGLPQESDK